ncbi:MAG: hypothetical protein R3B93_12405 [Bacteroidia bacterium]
MRFTQGAYAYYQLGESNYRLNTYQAAVTNFDNPINTFKKSELRDYLPLAFPKFMSSSG